VDDAEWKTELQILGKWKGFFLFKSRVCNGGGPLVGSSKQAQIPFHADV